NRDVGQRHGAASGPVHLFDASAAGCAPAEGSVDTGNRGRNGVRIVGAAGLSGEAAGLSGGRHSRVLDHRSAETLGAVPGAPSGCLDAEIGRRSRQVADGAAAWISFGFGEDLRGPKLIEASRP